MVRINPLKQAILQALFMGVSFCIFFAAYFPCEALLTSFRPRTSFLTLAIGYFFYGFSCLISPTTIKLLGPRVCLLLGAIPYPLWIGAQLLGIDGLCYAVSPFLGLGAAHLWPSSGTYLHKLNYWVMQENAVTFKTEVVPLAATQQDAPSPADTIQSPSPRTLSSPALPARRSSSIPAHEPVSPAEPLVSAPAVPVADPLPSLPSPPACTEMTPPAAGKLPSPTQPSPTTPQPPLPSLAPPAPAPVAASNMGLLSGTFYFMMSFSSVVGFLISSLLVADLALVYLTLFIIGCCGVGAMLLIPPIPAATAARAPPEKPPRAPATDARLPICASVPSASTGSVPPPRPRRRIVLAPVIADIAHSVRDTFDLFFSPAILLFQLTFVLYGMLYGFFVGAVPPLVATVAFVSPALICRGACCMLASPLFGRLSDRVGRFRVMGALYAIAGVALALVTTAVYARPAADWVFFLAYLAFGAFEGGTPTGVCMHAVRATLVLLLSLWPWYCVRGEGSMVRAPFLGTISW